MNSDASLRFDGRVAIVTGAGGGLGRSHALQLAARGARVIVNDLGAARDGTLGGVTPADEGVAEIRAAGGTALANHSSVTDPLAVQALVDQAMNEWGRIDILVNNAGITGGNGTTWELDPVVWRRVIEVNLIAPYLTCRHLAPKMAGNGWGRIVNIASVAGKEGNPNASHYSASKAGLIALTKSLGKELASKGVLVNAVTPAAAKTAMFDTMAQTHIDYMLSKIPMGRFLQVDELAAMVCWLSSDDCSFSTGAVFDITGGRATY